MISDEEYREGYTTADGRCYAELCAGPCACPGQSAACRCGCYGCRHHCSACHCRARREDPDWPYFDVNGTIGLP